MRALGGREASLCRARAVIQAGGVRQGRSQEVRKAGMALKVKPGDSGNSPGETYWGSGQYWGWGGGSGERQAGLGCGIDWTRFCLPETPMEGIAPGHGSCASTGLWPLSASALRPTEWESPSCLTGCWEDSRTLFREAPRTQAREAELSASWGHYHGNEGGKGLERS